MTIRKSTRRVAVAAGFLVAALVPASSALADSSGAAPARTADAADHAKPIADHPPTLPPRVALPKGWQPEGITSGPGSRFYVGSLAGGAIYAGDLRTGKGSVLVTAVTGGSLRGLFWDSRTNLVWAVGAEGTTGVVLAFDGTSGDLKSRTTVPGAGFLNDLVVTKRAVWVTDSSVDRLTRVQLGKGGQPTTKPATFVALGAPWPTAGAFRANGIRALSDGSLLLNHTTAGGLWRVDPRHGSVTKIVVKGSPAIVSGDGIELVGNTAYVVRGSGGDNVTAVRLRLHDGVWSGRITRLLTSPDLSVPSTATFAAGSIWAVNARFGVTSPTTADYWVTQLPLKKSSGSHH